MRHETYNVRGVQFHPESVMTPHGKAILRNFLYQSEVQEELYASVDGGDNLV